MHPIKKQREFWLPNHGKSDIHQNLERSGSIPVIPSDLSAKVDHSRREGFDSRLVQGYVDEDQESLPD